MLVDVEFNYGKFDAEVEKYMPVRITLGVYTDSFFLKETCTFDLDNSFEFKIRDEKGLKAAFEWIQSPQFIASHGTCDNHQQVLDRYPEIAEGKDSYIIALNLIEKEKYPGFRFHKNGEYIGTQKREGYEHLGDEPHIEKLYVFHVYQVTEKK